MEGQINLSDAINRTIDFVNEEGKHTNWARNYGAFGKTSRFTFRRKNITINGEKASGSLIDFRIYFFSEMRKIIRKRKRSLFYLPKLEHIKKHDGGMRSSISHKII